MPSSIIHVRDARTLPFGDGSAHLMVTSPPYWCTKRYTEDHAEIGWGQSYSDYLFSMNEVMRECVRVLHPGCRMAINIGDQYLRASEHERYRVLSIPSDIIRMCTTPPNDLDFMGSVIWRKISTTHTSGGGSWMGSTYWPRDGQITYEHEYVLFFKKLGKGPKVTAEAKRSSTLTKEQRSRWFRGIWDDIHPARQLDHPAAFPLELPDRIIRMYSYWGETVLDPFMGTGSTALAANLCGRNAVGCELSTDFVSIIEQRLGEIPGGHTIVRDG